MGHFLQRQLLFMEIKRKRNRKRQTRTRGNGGAEKRGTAEEGKPAAGAAVSLTASRQHIHQAPTMLRERNRNPP